MAEEEAQALNTVSEVILKKRKNTEALALRKKAQFQYKNFQIRKNNDSIKKPEDFIFEYRNQVTLFLLFSSYNTAIFNF